VNKQDNEEEEGEAPLVEQREYTWMSLNVSVSCVQYFSFFERSVVAAICMQ
jgi:hypothetical protein